MASSKDTPASDPRHDGQTAAVEKILSGLGLAEKRRVLVMNKIDRLPPGEGKALAHSRDAVAISAATGDGLTDLVHACDRLLWDDRRLPFADVAAGAPPTERAAEPSAEPGPERRLLPAALRRVS